MGVSDKLFRDKMTQNIASIEQKYQRAVRAGRSPEELAAIRKEKEDAQQKLDYANRAWGAAKETGKQLSDGFYNTLANSTTTRQDFKNMMTGGPVGNQYDVRAATTRENARLYGNEAANRGMEAQQSQQVAERNAFGEAGKQASMQNQAENKQAVQNLSAAAGTSAALSRKTNVPDVKYQEGRQDQARQRAAESRKEADIARQDAVNMYGASDEYKISSRDYNWFRDEADRLALAKDNQRQTPPKDEPDDKKPEEAPVEPETVPTTTSEWQNVMNYMTYGTDVTSDWSKDGGKDGGKADAYVKAKGWQPLTPEEVRQNGLFINDVKGYSGDSGAFEELMKKLRPEFYNEWFEKSGRRGAAGNVNKGDAAYNDVVGRETEEVPQQLAVGTDNAQPGMALVGEEGPELVMMNGGEQVVPTAQTKQYLNQNNIQAPVMGPTERALSDFRMKCLREDFERDVNLSPRGWKALAEMQGGKFRLNGRDYDFFDDNEWDDEDSVLDGYAEHIKNYLYTYKPEATEIDPDIDPEQEHIGPMAQDIEQVNPACIQKTPEGVETVDTARLAMMNAGAIGDLARRMKEIEARLR